ncbi:hypothetical protein M885DRAFT_592000, partial [Pelagophyceae sp. CCMP2097]
CCANSTVPAEILLGPEHAHVSPGQRPHGRRRVLQHVRLRRGLLRQAASGGRQLGAGRGCARHRRRRAGGGRRRLATAPDPGRVRARRHVRRRASGGPPCLSDDGGAAGRRQGVHGRAPRGLQSTRRRALAFCES